MGDFEVLLLRLIEELGYHLLSMHALDGFQIGRIDACYMLVHAVEVMMLMHACMPYSSGLINIVNGSKDCLFSPS